MYGGKPITGGIVGSGTLAMTGADPFWPIIVAAIAFAIGGLLMIRQAYIRKIHPEV